MDAADVSKATAYRRLGELEDAGLIESKTVFDLDGYHPSQSTAVVESIDIQFGSDGATVNLKTERCSGQTPKGSIGAPLADD
jgi:hypothetical protein